MNSQETQSQETGWVQATSFQNSPPTEWKRGDPPPDDPYEAANSVRLPQPTKRP